MDLEFPETPTELTCKVAKRLGEFETYLRNNEEFIPNLGSGGEMASGLAHRSWNQP